MKVVTIEIEDVPNSYMRPYWDKAKIKPIKVTELTDMGVVPESESTFTRETYPLSEFAYGNHREPFYIRDKDKKALEEMINAYIKKAQFNVLDELEDWFLGKDSPIETTDLFLLIREMKRKVDQ